MVSKGEGMGGGGMEGQESRWDLDMGVLQRGQGRETWMGRELERRR